MIEVIGSTVFRCFFAVEPMQCIILLLATKLTIANIAHALT